MDLKMRDVSKMLKVSEGTVQRWVEEGKIPAYKLGEHYRFSPMEIEAWVMNRDIEEELPSFLEEKVPHQGSNQYSLFRAIHKGAVWSDFELETKEEIFKEAMTRLTALELDPDVVTELLLDREKMMPTALNQGVAVPHTREVHLQRRKDVVGIAFLKQPIEYGALDGQPVHTLFFLFASSDERHLHLLAKIAHLATDAEARKLFAAKPNKLRLLQFIKEWEGSLKSV